MRKFSKYLPLITLILGIVCGISLHFVLRLIFPLSVPPSETFHPNITDMERQQAYTPELVAAAYTVVCAIKEGDYASISNWVHPVEGVTFTPFNTVQKDRDLTFTSMEVKGFDKNTTLYLWGIYPISGTPIQLTPSEFFAQLLQNKDYTTAPLLGVNRTVKSVSAAENVTDQYQGASYVDFHFPQVSEDNPQWYSLKLVFQPVSTGGLKLVAIIRSLYFDQ